MPQKIAVKLYSSIDPHTGILVGEFLSRRDRRKWVERELPPQLDVLAASLGLSGITVDPETCEFVGDMPGRHILPDDVIQTIRRQYLDLYATH